MEIQLYQVDAFADQTFSGNPAAVCPLDGWIDDERLQQIAEENSLSETAFYVVGEDCIELRWFTPEHEVDLCGHATLAAAHVLFKYRNFSSQQILFSTRSGELIVSKSTNSTKMYDMNFPASFPTVVESPDLLLSSLGLDQSRVLDVRAAEDYMVVLPSEADVMALTPNFSLMQELDRRGVIVTSIGENEDFVSRCFFPKYRVNEDPVTGSAHCQMTPYWANRLAKNSLLAKQVSQRSGSISCELKGDRVILSGNVADYLVGRINIENL